MQDNRFTYSPALGTAALRPLSFQEFHSRTTAPQPTAEQPRWTPPPPPSYAPPAFTTTSTYTPPSIAPASFVASLPPNRQITFGQGTQSSSDPVRITFNQSNTSALVPAFTSAAKPVVIASEENRRPELPAPSLKSVQQSNQVEGVKNFVVDTNDFKYVKEDEFTGCFHCFSPVTYDTKPKKGLCG